MPRYAPLPRIELDPRTEAELVNAAAKRVYEASGATINDFSSGSPIMALLEGQAFSQAEFLQFANEFPESVLVEWIGPFLGAQRRTGSGAVADITFTITPRDEPFVVFPGYQLATDSNLTGGITVDYVTTERLTIPPQESQGKVRAVSLLRTTNANVAPNTITRSVSSLAGVVSVTNEQSSYGASNPELLSEVKERFFSLIRRRNPVSAEDWQDFFTDALGVGTSTVVLPRYSQGDIYSYDDDYISSNPGVGLFVLNPDGFPISTAQRDALENLAKWSVPVEFTPYVYPMQVDDVDVEMSVQYNPAKSYSRNLQTFSRSLRDNLFAVMRPNAVFTVDQDFSVNDLESALKTTFPFTFGSSNQYVDPELQDFKVFSTPQMLGAYKFLESKTKPFEVGPRVKTRDLLIESGTYAESYFPALKDFEPAVNDKMVNVNLGNLDLTIIKELKAELFKAGDVVASDGKLFVFLVEHNYTARMTVEELIKAEILSDQKVYTEWEMGRSYSPFGVFGEYNPEIIAFKEDDSNFNTYLPPSEKTVQSNQKPGHPVYVVAKPFSSSLNTTSLGQVQAAGYASKQPASIELLKSGGEYSTGMYVKTPSVAELDSQQLTTEFCYLDKTRGAQDRYAYVLKSFSFFPENELGIADFTKAYDELLEVGALQEIDVIPFVDCKGNSSFASKPFRYSARFFAGEYVRFRELGGFNARDLEDCFEASGECTSEYCQQLFEQNLPLPRYFYALKDFTPDSTDVDAMVEEGLMVEVEASIFKVDYRVTIHANEPVTTFAITKALDAQHSVASTSLPAGTKVLVVNEYNTERGAYTWNGNTVWVRTSSGVPVNRDMFRFAPGDVVTVRNNSTLRSYSATKHVTPITDLDVYYRAGVFVEANFSETVKWIDPTYHLEDNIQRNVDGAQSYYRVMRAFTPPAEREVWYAGNVQNTPRIEEFYKNTLKMVNLSSCADVVKARLINHVGTVKLGNLRVNMTSRSSQKVIDTVVWESTRFNSDTASLSSSSMTDGSLTPVDYGDGTFAL